MTFKTKTIGLLRFSVLTPTYYSERFATLEDTAAHLFSPERMAFRFHLFETLCLPSLVRQSDPDFECVVLTAESMPAEHLGRLTDLIAPLDNIHLRPVGTDKHYQLLKGGYDSVEPGAATHRVLFRLDDDDAVDLHFVARTRRRAHAMLEMTAGEAPFVIAYNRGFYVRFQEGENEVFDACERAPLSTGTTLVAPVGHPQNPYRYNHRALPQHYTTLQDLSEPAYIRTIHDDNKSTPNQSGLTHKMRRKQIKQALKQGFDVDLAMLKAL